MFLGIRIALIVLILGAFPAQPAAAQGEGWREVGPLAVPSVYCADSMRPATLLLSYTQSNGSVPAGSYAYNWATGEQTLLADVPFVICNTANGLLYGLVPGTSIAPDAPALRFSSRDPQPREIARTPTHIAIDGSLQLYSLGNGLWSSADGGLTWQQRRLPTTEPVLSMAVAAADGRALYLAAGTVASNGITLPYTIYFSPDAGVTWEQRSTGVAPNGGSTIPPGVSLRTFISTAAPVDTVQLVVSTSTSSRFGTTTTYLSTDGGRNFPGSITSGAYERGQLLHTREGLLRFTGTATPGVSASAPTLERSTDGGRSWQPLTLPFTVNNEPPVSSFITQAYYVPDALMLSDVDGALWFSPDGGSNWQQVGRNMSFYTFTPYLPLSAFNIENDRLYLLELPDMGRSFTRPAVANGAPDGAFFPQTGHNLGGVFKRHWERYGGLAQFGYPKSEPLREINPADGQVYLVQYFERNRFEYHPEFAGTTNEVLLGLLGNQVTAQRRAAGEPPFARVENPNAADTIYFPQTGHTLSGAFRSYWARNGGEAIFGYPISEPFAEQNPADGQSYLVQYFERNRFEYHPENAGTPSEVLLGLLGNQVLQEKGWE